MVIIEVPATTANLGPGFDLLGLALQRSDQYTFSEGKNTPFTYELLGVDSSRYGIRSDTDNLVYRAFVRLYQAIGKTPPNIQVTCQTQVPICRGLGSSAAAVVAGLTGANHLAGNPLDLDQLLLLATELEGHPDNVAPALLGGLVISLKTNHEVIYHKYELTDPELTCVLVIPDFTLETREARRVLPSEVAFEDAVFNMSRTTLLVSALAHRDYAHLAELMQDRLHQPYRQHLIPGYSFVKEMGLQAGAYGIAISGAGPTILAFAPKAKAQQVGQAMTQAFQKAGVDANWFTSQIHNHQITG